MASKILIIDDSPTVLKMMELTLKEEGYETISARDGAEGIRLARQELPDLIIVDFLMTKMTGFQVCQLLRKDERCKDIPLLVALNKGDDFGPKLSETYERVAYIVKPFLPVEIVERVRKLLGPTDKGREEVKKIRSLPLPPRETAPEKNFLPTIELSNIIAAIQDPLIDKVKAEVNDYIKERVEEVLLEEIQRHASNMVQEVFRHFYAERIEKFLEEKIKEHFQFDGRAAEGLRGNMSEFKLPEVLQLIGLQQKTGKLILTRNGDMGTIFLRQGKVIFASQRGRETGQLLGRRLIEEGKINAEQLEVLLEIQRKTGERLGKMLTDMGYINHRELEKTLETQTCQTVYNIIRWSEGSFHFEEVDLPSHLSDVNIELDVQNLILEGVRRLDEWHLIEQKIPNFQMVFMLSSQNRARMDNLKLSEEERILLRLINGRRNISELMTLSGLDDFTTCKTLCGLLSAGLIQELDKVT